MWKFRLWDWDERFCAWKKKKKKKKGTGNCNYVPEGQWKSAGPFWCLRDYRDHFPLDRCCLVNDWSSPTQGLLYHAHPTVGNPILLQISPTWQYSIKFFLYKTPEKAKVFHRGYPTLALLYMIWTTQEARTSVETYLTRSCKNCSGLLMSLSRWYHHCWGLLSSVWGTLLKSSKRLDFYKWEASTFGALPNNEGGIWREQIVNTTTCDKERNHDFHEIRFSYHVTSNYNKEYYWLGQCSLDEGSHQSQTGSSEPEITASINKKFDQTSADLKGLFLLHTSDIIRYKYIMTPNNVMLR